MIDLYIARGRLSPNNIEKGIIVITIGSAEIILLVSNFRMVFLTLGREHETSGCSLNFRLIAREYLTFFERRWLSNSTEKRISNYSIILTIAFDSLFSDTLKLLLVLIDLGMM